MTRVSRVSVRGWTYLDAVDALVEERRIEALAEQLQLDLIEHVRECLELRHVLEHIGEVLEHVLKVLVLGLAQIVHGQVREAVRDLVEQLLHVELLSTLHQIGGVRHLVEDLNVQRHDVHRTVLLVALADQCQQRVESTVGAKVVDVLLQHLRGPRRAALR